MFSADLRGACLFTTALLQVLECSWCISVLGPAKYSLLSEDLVLHYNISIANNEELISAFAKIHHYPSNRTIFHQEVNPIQTVGTLSFQCGTLAEPGKIYVYITATARAKEKTRIIQVLSSMIEVQWPLMQLVVPLRAQTFSYNTSVEVILERQLCIPMHQNISTYLQLRYSKRFQNAPSYNNKSQLLGPVQQLFTTVRHSYIIPCKVLDHEGIYRFSLEANIDGRLSTVTSSSEVQVILNSEYSISTGVQNALPCTEPGVVVFFHYPQCILPYDRIRLFGRLISQVPQSNNPTSMVARYVSETRVIKGQNMAIFPCKDFKNASSLEYCFKYVSVSSVGAVSELHSACLAVNLNSGLCEFHITKDSWSQWSPWSPCTMTCGATGIRIRHRFCESHIPQNHLLHCNGEAVQSQRCQFSACEGQEHVSSFMNTIAGKIWCRCGCQVDLSSTFVVASSGRHCSGISTWMLKAHEGAAIRFRFIYFNLNTTFEWLKIRNGNHPSSDLLELYLFGKRLDVLQSTSNEVVMQFHTLMDDGIGGGFIVEIKALFPELTSSRQELLLVMKDRKLVGNSVHKVGFAICASLFCAAVLCAVAHRINWTKVTKFSRKKFPTYQGSIQDFQLVDRATLQSYVSDATETTELWEPLIQQQPKVHLRRHHSNEYVNKRDAFSILNPLVQEDHEDSFSSEGSSAVASKLHYKNHPRSESTDAECLQNVSSKIIIHPYEASKPTDKTPLGKKLPVATVSPQPARALITKNLQKALQENERIEYTEKSVDLKENPTNINDPSAEETDKGTFKKTNRFGKKDNLENVNEKNNSQSPCFHKHFAAKSDDETCKHITPIGSKQENIANKQRKPEMAGSSQEISSSGMDAENDFEYDYYDYNVHYDPGSVFSREPAVVSWLPPFIPRLSSRSQINEMDESSNEVLDS